MANLAVCLLVALVGVICVAAILGGDWRGASLAAYNKSTVDALQGLVGSHSHYYALEKPGDHRAYVGGAWDEIGSLELAFLQSKGLNHTHKLLDVGCGALRGGVHFVRFLEARHYFGIDLNPHLLDAGHEKELDDMLRQKCPRSHLRATANFDATPFGVSFDYALAVSVWTHLPMQAIEGSLRQVAAVLARPHGVFYATFYACPENAPLTKRILQFRSGSESITSHGDRDWFHQKASSIRKAARKAGLRMRYLGDWGHPRQQLMLEFRHADDGRSSDNHRRLLPIRHGQRKAAKRQREPAMTPTVRPRPAAKSSRDDTTSTVRDVGCPSASYPRSLRNVLSDPEDRAHLSRIYFERVLPRHDSPTYYNLLHHLAVNRADERAWSAIEKVRGVVHESFGPQFDIINDFYSFRSQRKQIFPNWHQDIEFWLTGPSCDGFNIWVLLDHHRMNYSFDIYDVEANRELYDGLYAQHRGHGRDQPPLYNTTRPLFSPSEYVRRSPTSGGFVAGPLHGDKRSGQRRERVTHGAYGQVPLEAGDALIVRQIEIHRTDMHPLDAHQWRLALGFKVLRRDVAIRTATTTSSPFGYDLETCRARWPGLIPAMDVGKTLPHVYNRSSLASLGELRRSNQAREWFMWVLSTPIMLVPVIGVALLACAACGDRR